MLLDLDFLILETAFNFERWKYKLENHNFVWSHVKGCVGGREGKMPIEDSLPVSDTRLALCGLVPCL